MPVWLLAQTERQGSLQRLGMALSHQFVTGGTTLLLRALRAQQVTEARRAAHELASGGEFEPLGNGLLGLLHGERSKTETDLPLGKAFVRESGAPVRSTQPLSIFLFPSLSFSFVSSPMAASRGDAVKREKDS